jgi:FkbH-like protein
VDIYEGDYGLYRYELEQSGETSSQLAQFAPDVVLLAIDAHHAARGTPQEALADLSACWDFAARNLKCAVIQQTLLPVFPPLLGSNEHRQPTSPHYIVERTNQLLRGASALVNVPLLALDSFFQPEGLRAWHDAALWHRAKQEVHPAMTHLYGEHVARLLAAMRGRSFKALVLDLDNTLWGGVIGDDGLEGIVLGQGNAVGESYVAFQQYAKALAQRGIVLAVCSKNDLANALAPFTGHPEMVLRRDDIAVFTANWQDKPANLRAIAEQLNLGLDALVFADDNPFERELVRRELPMVAVPEMPEDPAEYVRVLAAAGYFEGLGVTGEDRERAAQYAANAKREAGRVAAGSGNAGTDLQSYLAGLRMELLWRPFDAAGRARIVQLINKTNQFNLTTRRVADEEIARTMARADVLALQFRLKDTYGDNGMIGIVLCEPASAKRLAAEGFARADAGASDLYIDTWLMSCRVLGRQVEEAMMNVVADQARARGARRIFGHYIPTAKNAMVREHYERMGFELVETAADGATLWMLDVGTYQPHATQIASLEGELANVG